MFRHKAETAVILGAGFSKCAKLPLQQEFSNLLISPIFDGNLDLEISNNIIEFLRSVFNWNGNDTLPSLEDIFTMIDLSTGSGHCLGREYSPQKLRAIRRMLIYRCFSILDQEFSRSEDIDKLLKYLIPELERNHTHFITLNWDIVLERHLEYIPQNPKIDYCVLAEPWIYDYGNEPPIGIAKVHGSSNWVYCDNCRGLFYDRDRKLSLAINAGLFESDFLLLNNRFSSFMYNQAVNSSPENYRCPKCESMVGPHIATFSFKKNYRTHAFTSSWLAAEQILDQANKWIFVGYSMPDSDYEFKHLLKSSQIKNTRNKKIEVVVLNDLTAEEKYASIFGRNNVEIYQEGLKGYLELKGISV